MSFEFSISFSKLHKSISNIFLSHVKRYYARKIKPEKSNLLLTWLKHLQTEDCAAFEGHQDGHSLSQLLTPNKNNQFGQTVKGEADNTVKVLKIQEMQIIYK